MIRKRYGNDTETIRKRYGNDTKLIHREDGNYFMAIATMCTQGPNTPVLQKYMKADIRIIVSNKPLWKQVFEQNL